MANAAVGCPGGRLIQRQIGAHGGSNGHGLHDDNGFWNFLANLGQDQFPLSIQLTADPEPLFTRPRVKIQDFPWFSVGRYVYGNDSGIGSGAFGRYLVERNIDDQVGGKGMRGKPKLVSGGAFQKGKLWD